MFDHDIHEVLDYLDEKKPLPPEASESPFERICKKPSSFFQWISIGCFIIICALAASTAAFQLTSLNLLSLAKLLLAISLVSALLWMLLDIVPVVVTISLFHKYAHRTRLLEISHDFQNAADLAQFDKPTLEVVDKWLSLRVERMRVRLGVFLGGSDKVAVFALIVGIWGIWSNFPTSSANWTQHIYAAFSALIGGLATGGLLVNVQIKKLTYQRDLLAIALHSQRGELHDSP